jgi:hypothetical protein
MKSQTQKLYELLKDGERHSTREIQIFVYGSDHLGSARIAARIADLRKEGHDIPNAERDEHDPTVYWYRMKVPIVSLPVKNCQVNLQPALFNMPESEREPSVIF